MINTPLLELLELHNIVEFCGTTINEEALERYYVKILGQTYVKHMSNILR